MIRAWLFAAGALAAAQAAAQIVVPPSIDPGAIQQRQIDEERRRREEEREQRKPVTQPLKRDGLDQPAVRAAPEGPRFEVREIQFTPSEILSAEELESIARQYRGRRLNMADLQELAERVNALYRAKGVVTARAVIPPQEISEGVVRVRLVEGRVGRLRIDGNASTSERYIAERLQPPGSLVDLKRLENDLVRFNRTNDVQLRAELKPGEQFGTTDFLLSAAEPPRHELRAFIDNAGSESTGQWRSGVTYLNRSLLGWRDDLSLSTTHADGLEGYSASYGFPFNPSGGRITAAYYKDRTQVKHGPFAALDISGKSTAGILSLRQPVYLGEKMQVDLLAGAKKRESSTWLSGVFLQRTETEDGTLGAEVQLSDARGFSLASYSVTAGEARVPDRTSYTVGRGTLRRTHELGRGWSARGNLSFQHSDDDLLPSSEQFFIGGEGSVRGYPVGVYSGDQGASLNLELHHPLAVVGRGTAGLPEIGLTGFFFFDHGLVKPFRPPNSQLGTYDRLSAAGWGINAAMHRHVSARVTFAYALNDLPFEPRRYEIHFQLVASMF